LLRPDHRSSERSTCYLTQQRTQGRGREREKGSVAVQVRASNHPSGFPRDLDRPSRGWREPGVVQLFFPCPRPKTAALQRVAGRFSCCYRTPLPFPCASTPVWPCRLVWSESFTSRKQWNFPLFTGFWSFFLGRGRVCLCVYVIQFSILSIRNMANSLAPTIDGRDIGFRPVPRVPNRALTWAVAEGSTPLLADGCSNSLGAIEQRTSRSRRPAAQQTRR